MDTMVEEIKMEWLGNNSYQKGVDTDEAKI